MAVALVVLAGCTGQQAVLADRVPPSPPPNTDYRDVAGESRDGDELHEDVIEGVTQVRNAAIARDVDGLVSLCAPCSDPAVAQDLRTRLDAAGLAELARILLTHPAGTDAGPIYPGFAVGPAGTDHDLADVDFLGLPPGARYTGMTTGFDVPFELELPVTWQGVRR